MSLNDDQNLECPLCMEPFEMDDFNFFPCTCGYQICRFCWHRIRTDENGLCPACRKQYPEDPADFKPLSAEELQKIKNEKRQKDQQRKQKMSESRKHLANVRVVQKNLVFVVGLPARLADAEVLKKHDYFGKFGRIHKVVVNQSTSYAGSQGPSASAYVTYYRAEDTLRAIKSVNNIQVDGRILKASLGTTKYCSHFLKNQQCPKSDCMYLHELGDEAASFTKEDMQQGKHQEYERKLQEQILGCNNRKQTSSPTLQSNHMNSNNKEAWPSVPQNMKESRPNRLVKDSPQGQKTDTKQNRSKNKHNSSVDSQKSKKNRGKLTDLSHQNNSVNLSKTSNSKEENSISKKNQKQKHQKDISAQPSNQISLQRLDVQIVHRGSAVTSKISDVSELNNKNAQNSFVNISEQPVSTLTTTNIKIVRSESPSLPSSPTSSSSSSLFTPFGSFSSNFMSSSSPSPPPTTTSHSFGILGPTLQDSNSSAVTASTSPMGIEQGKRKSPNCHLFSDSENSNSLFSHMTSFPLSSECGTYSGHPSTDDEILQSNSSDWHSNYSLNHSQKHQEDDLDFDPWDESAKGLADLMAKEAVHNPPYTTTSLPPGFSPSVTTNAVPTQRIAPPPPGFGSRQHMGNLGHTSNPFGVTNTVRDIGHPLMSGSSQLFQDAPQSQLGYSSHNKLFPQYNSRDLNSRVNEILRMKNWQESFRALFPNINVSFGSRGTLQKHHNQNAPTWSPSVRELSWLAHDSAILTPGNNSTETQRESPPFWMKSLQQLTLDDSSNGFNGHSSYVTPFALRGHWPSSAQCPPPGFVAPSRSPANTPFQHSQVNQKI